MKIAPLAEVKAKLSNYINSTDEGPVIVTKNGRPRALLICVPENEEDLERFVLACTPRFRKILDNASHRIRTKGGMEHNDFWKKVKKSKN